MMVNLKLLFNQNPKCCALYLDIHKNRKVNIKSAERHSNKCCKRIFYKYSVIITSTFNPKLKPWCSEQNKSPDINYMQFNILSNHAQLYYYAYIGVK